MEALRQCSALRGMENLELWLWMDDGRHPRSANFCLRRMRLTETDNILDRGLSRCCASFNAQKGFYPTHMDQRTEENVGRLRSRCQTFFFCKLGAHPIPILLGHSVNTEIYTITLFSSALYGYHPKKAELLLFLIMIVTLMWTLKPEMNWVLWLQLQLQINVLQHFSSNYVTVRNIFNVIQCHVTSC